MKIAFVYDRVIKFGGAERILLALHEIWPEAPLYTAVYNKSTSSWTRDLKVISSRLPSISVITTPYAFENLSFDTFDIVISITSQDAKSVITKPSSLHICYCLTPTRYLWSGYNEYYRQPSFGIFNPLVRMLMKFTFNSFRKWDLISSRRPDNYLAISKTVKRRLSRFYSVNSNVIYPPVNTEVFNLPKKKPSLDYFLIVSRLVPYKRIDYAINAFNILNLPLKIIGSGIDENRLKHLARTNIEFISGDLTDQKLCWYYQNCLSLIFPGEEDFGLTPLEAQSCGRPVIAFKKGGSEESIVNYKTGIFYSEKNEKSLIKAIKKFKHHKFSQIDCRNNAVRFSKSIFTAKMKKIVDYLFKEYQKSL